MPCTLPSSYTGPPLCSRLQTRFSILDVFAAELGALQAYTTDWGQDSHLPCDWEDPVSAEILT